MSGGKTKIQQKTDNSIDPWSKQQWQTQSDRIRGLLGGPSTPTQNYAASGAVPGAFTPRPETGFLNAAINGAYNDLGRAGAFDNMYDVGGGAYMQGGGGGLAPISGGSGGQPAQETGIMAGLQYDGQLSAGLNDYDARARQMLLGENGQGGTFMQGGRDALSSIAPMRAPQTFADFNADTYVNPYTDDMIGRMTGDVEEAAARARAQSDSAALANRAYGGSRHGVRDSMLDEQMLDTIADQSAQMRFNAWDRGADRFYQDQNLGMQYDAQRQGFDLQRAGMLADFDARELGALQSQGGIERGVEDRRYATQYADYLRQRDEMWRRIQTEMGLLGGIPIITDGETSNVSKNNPGALGYYGAFQQLGSQVIPMMYGGGA